MIPEQFYIFMEQNWQEMFAGCLILGFSLAIRTAYALAVWSKR